MIHIKTLRIMHQQRQLLDISFSIHRSLALVGESGSGKSLTLKALLNLLPSSLYCEKEVQSDVALIAGKSMAFVPQSPFTALSPLTKIRYHFNGDPLPYLEMVGLNKSHLNRYASELSGGQLQRIVLAIALSQRPTLLLLDEPTTALDPQTRRDIIALLQQLQHTLGFSMLFVSHDLLSAEQLCDDALVIKEGGMIESAPMQTLLSSPKANYTKMLLEANFANRAFRT